LGLGRGGHIIGGGRQYRLQGKKGLKLENSHRIRGSGDATKGGSQGGHARLRRIPALLEETSQEDKKKRTNYRFPVARVRKIYGKKKQPSGEQGDSALSMGRSLGNRRGDREAFAKTNTNNVRKSQWKRERVDPSHRMRKTAFSWERCV